jgi:hypothetical protein
MITSAPDMETDFKNRPRITGRAKLGEIRQVAWRVKKKDDVITS